MSFSIWVGKVGQSRHNALPESWDDSNTEMERKSRSNEYD